MAMRARIDPELTKQYSDYLANVRRVNEGLAAAVSGASEVSKDYASMQPPVLAARPAVQPPAVTPQEMAEIDAAKSTTPSLTRGTNLGAVSNIPQSSNVALRRFVEAPSSILLQPGQGWIKNEETGDVFAITGGGEGSRGTIVGLNRLGQRISAPTQGFSLRSGATPTAQPTNTYTTQEGLMTEFGPDVSPEAIARYRSYDRPAMRQPAQPAAPAPLNATSQANLDLKLAEIDARRAQAASLRAQAEREALVPFTTETPAEGFAEPVKSTQFYNIRTGAAVNPAMSGGLPPAASRVIGQEYDLPQGKYIWTAQGWVPK